MTSVAPPTRLDDISLDWLTATLGPVDSWDSEPIGEGFGLSGTTHRIDLVMADGTSATVVVKFAPASQTAREIAFFDHCAVLTPIRTPGFIAGGVDQRTDHGVLLLEYVTEARQGDVLAGCSLNEASDLAIVLARLHATWWGNTAALPDSLAASTQMPDLPRIREGRLDRLNTLYGEVLSPAQLDLINNIEGKLSSDRDTLYEGPLTLLHGDFHLDNVLFPTVGEPVVLDWQGSRTGPPAVDVARFLVECLTAEQRSQYGAQALSAYFSTLAEHDIEVESDLRPMIVPALRLLLPGVINWLGRPKPDPPNSRPRRLGANILHTTTTAITELTAHRAGGVD